MRGLKYIVSVVLKGYYSRTSSRCMDWKREVNTGYEANEVAPHVGAWIEIVDKDKNDSPPVSHLL